MDEFTQQWQQVPDPQLSCTAFLLRACRTGGTPRQIQTLLKAEGFSSQQISCSADELLDILPKDK
jgi:hypothetical protein